MSDGGEGGGAGHMREDSCLVCMDMNVPSGLVITFAGRDSPPTSSPNLGFCPLFPDSSNGA